MAAVEPTPPPDLSVLELAYLAGGPRRVMLTALSTLVERGVLDGALRPRRALDPRDGLADVHLAAFESVRRRGGPDLDALKVDCAPAIAGIRDRLRSLDLVRPRNFTDTRWYSAIGAVVFGLVLVAMFLPPSLVVVGPVWAAMFALVGIDALHGRRQRRAARAAMGTARARHAALDPRYRPAYASYGGNALSTGVALFGIGALGLVLPGLVREPAVAALGLHGTDTGATSFSGSTSCGSDGGTACSSCGSSCGGGGCGGCGGGGGD